MISKNRIKFVQSLHRKKYRQRYGQFTVEGEKSVAELLNSRFKIDSIYATRDWVDMYGAEVDCELTICEQIDLKPVSYFSSPSQVVAVVSMDDAGAEIDWNSSWFLALDGINDPGNLGTMIRVADWYGIESIVCTTDTVDQYNPKVISSSMGSFTRVKIFYTDLERTLASANRPVYCADMRGRSVDEYADADGGIILIGSEANGIRVDIDSIPHEVISIPAIGQAESLNASVAAGIICDRLIRKTI